MRLLLIKTLFFLIFLSIANISNGQNRKLKVKYYPPVGVNNLKINPSWDERSRLFALNVKRKLQIDTSAYEIGKISIPFSEIYWSDTKRPEIIILPIIVDNFDSLKIIFFSYNCQSKKFMGESELSVDNNSINNYQYQIIKDDLFKFKVSANREGEIKAKFESYYFYFLAKWYQDKNLEDTASIYLRCNKSTVGQKHKTEWDYTFRAFMGEYKYYKSTCEIRYIDYRLYDAILAEECPRKLFPGDEGLKKCQKLRQEWSKYPATMAYIDALVWFERYRYYIKKDSALSEKYSLEFAQKFEFFKNILDKREYDKRETNLWQDNKMNLIFEGDTLIAKYKIISKCGELSDMAYQFENSLEYDEAMKYHFWALKFCHNKNSFERIEAIINTKELIYRKLISEGDSLCSIREYEQGKNKYREAVNYTLFPNLAISRIDRCRPPTTFPAEILPPVITPQDIFDVVKGIISTYNTINFNELPGQKITFQLDSRDRKKINVFIVSNIDEADFVIHASYYPSGSYKFKNEEIENGLIINILKTLDKVFGTHLDTSGIEIDITGSADFSGFNGEKLKVEDEYKNKSILVEDIRGGRFQLDDLINGSDYDKNLGLAFLRGYRKQQAILEECSEINLRYSLQAKVEGQYGSKYRNVKVVLKMKLR